MARVDPTAASLEASPGLGAADQRTRTRPAGRVGSRVALDTVIAPAVFTLVAIVLIVQDQGGYFPTSFGWSALGLLAVVVTWALAGGATDAGRRDALFFGALAALTAWVGLSITWSVDPAQSVLELERWFVLVAGCGAFLLLARRIALHWLGLALLLAISSICAYSLWTRLVPSAAGFDPGDPITSYRLSAPVGYWNALGAFAAMGVLLAIGYVTDPERGAPVRTLAAVCLTVLPLTVYFTFSRGAWLALAVGLLVAVALSPHRLRLVTEGSLFALVPAAAVLLASRSQALVDQNARFAAAVHQGRDLGFALIGMGVAAAASVQLVALVEPRLRPGSGIRRAYGGTLAVLALAVVAAALVVGGGPVSLAKRGYDSFATTAPVAEKANLNSRLFNVNGDGRPRMWEVAIDAVAGHWLTGRGAGSFERSWERSLKANETVRDAHGLYVETISELGIVGLVLLVALLAVPLVAGVSARAVALVPALVGGYSVFVVHNAIDWDWELSGVALTGLLLGCLLLVARRRGKERTLRLPVRAAAGTGALAVAGFALVAVIGNGALARAQAANQGKRYAAAVADARLARTWMPWSSEPLKALGQAQLEQGQVVAAAAAFRDAISVDRDDWQAWLDLAAAVKGRARTEAVTRAKALYPTSPEVAEFESSTSS